MQEQGRSLQIQKELTIGIRILRITHTLTPFLAQFIKSSFPKVFWRHSNSKLTICVKIQIKCFRKRWDLRRVIDIDNGHSSPSTTLLCEKYAFWFQLIKNFLYNVTRFALSYKRIKRLMRKSHIH